MAKITINPDQVKFIATSNETILNAGLAQKLNLSHSCKNGLCGSCKTKIISGEVILDPYNPKTLTPEEQKQGYTLLCRAHALTDVVLDIPNLLCGFPVKIMPAKVISITKINQIAIINLKLPANLAFGFYAGQYVDIMVKGKNRSYSIGISPLQKDEIEIHVKNYPGGIFSEYVWNELKVNDILRFKGPLGSFQLQHTNKPIICVCTGTGFAPIKAILEDMYLREDPRPITFYWGNSEIKDFYCVEVIEKWRHKLNIKIVLCISQNKESGYFFGRVTDALINDFNDLSNHEVYACGNPRMIESLFELSCTQLRLLRDNFFSDAFIPSAI
ncbi:MAG: 2Fe-2S iron-sulfur cluster binding domain-containing protein [Burkholderiales bacterium]|nr:2Fe-2S iron-sulfur cluster binding domain-containing protein [Burkholderiales bacterium]